MKQVTRFGLVVLVAVAMGCSNNTTNPLAPTGAGDAGAIAAVPDGAPTLKVTAPASPAPASGTVLDEKLTAPVLSVSNAETRFAGSVQLFTRFQLQEGSTTIAEPLVTPGGDGRSAWQAAVPLKYNTTYRWRARAELGDAYGPWSAVSEFRTPEEPVVVVGFTVPPACGPRPDPISDRVECVLAVASISPNWGACAGGSGVACHRFTRDVAAALAVGDPGWGLIGKNPGEQQCTLDRCGSLGGEGYGEDVVAYLAGPNIFNQWFGFDIVTGAGAPGASAGWSGPLSRRAGNYWAPVPRN
jgi:hypothetical protein